jgi:succinate dehydrogenase / fumarate reductase flavoprotein subunit
MDDSLRVNLVWSPSAGNVREEIPEISDEIARLVKDVSSVGKLVE